MMTPEAKAQQVLAELWTGALPVDPIQISRAMNVRVFENPELAESGKLKDNGDGTYSIHVKPSDPWVRKRFTVAHELGHLVLEHGPRPRRSNNVYSAFFYDSVERDANLFAAALLMPESAVMHFLDKGLGFDQMARKFFVSGQAMQIRLERLGVI
jgi:Zn-dependent peptidase ImmA (M78 family)